MVYFALLSAVFAALTSILAKIGIDGIDSNLATAIRNRGRACDGVAYCPYNGRRRGDWRDFKAKLDFFNSLWACDWSLLAMLLLCPKNRQSKRRRRRG